MAIHSCNPSNWRDEAEFTCLSGSVGLYTSKLYVRLGKPDIPAQGTLSKHSTGSLEAAWNLKLNAPVIARMAI
jgi:hypothetical protein